MTIKVFDWIRQRRRRTGLTDSDIVNGYVWVLGRRPSPEETASARAYFAAQEQDALHAFSKRADRVGGVPPAPDTRPADHAGGPR